MKKTPKLKALPYAPNRWKMFHRLVILLFLFAAVRAEDADVSYIIYIFIFLLAKYSNITTVLSGLYRA